MESQATKQQTTIRGDMDTTTQSYFQTELERRRTSLEAATLANVSDRSLQILLNSVDEALARINAGTFGICEVCNEPVEAERLLCNPLMRFCLDHLSGDEQRALERDLTLAGSGSGDGSARICRSWPFRARHSRAIRWGATASTSSLSAADASDFSWATFRAKAWPLRC